MSFSREGHLIMINKTEELINYINSLLNDASIVSAIPEDLIGIEGIQEIDYTVRNLRQSIRSIGNGDLSD